MGASRRVVRWLRGGYPIRFNRSFIREHGLPPLSHSADPTKVTQYQDQARCQALQSMINDLLEKNCVRRMEEGETGFFSRVFLVPKKSGGFRLVIDLSSLNEYLAPVTFEMDTLKKVKEFVTSAMWATSIDLSEAYHHIPMHKSSQIYLCFQIGKDRFMFLVLPFGLSSAPWVFTQVAKQLKVWTAQRQRMMFQYLDDWLNMFLSKRKASRGTLELVHQCKALGWLINEKKSELVPTQQIVFLGEKLDFAAMIAYPTAERKETVCAIINAAISDRQLQFGRAESLLGLLSATFPTVLLGRLHLRPLQAEVIALVRKGRPHAMRSSIPVKGQLEKSLRWWLSPTRWSPGVAFKPPTPDIVVFTDASLSGWGVVCEDANWHGAWKRSSHINWLELRVVLIALQLLSHRLRSRTVRFMIDNTTAVAYIRNQGGTRSPALLKLTTRIWTLATKLEVTLIPTHIKGQNNVLADLASRAGQILPAEWTLTQSAWSWLVNQSPWGQPQVELFANRWNHLLPVFMSPCDDASAEATDALKCPWPNRVLYAFPPTFLLTQLLQRMAKEPQYRMLLIVNWIPQAKWIPLLGTLPPFEASPFPVVAPLLRQPHWDHVQDPSITANLTLLILEKKT